MSKERRVHEVLLVLALGSSSKHLIETLEYEKKFSLTFPKRRRRRNIEARNLSRLIQTRERSLPTGQMVELVDRLEC